MSKLKAMVGSSSALECSVNGALYKQKQILSVQGTGRAGQRKTEAALPVFASSIARVADICMLGAEDETQPRYSAYSPRTDRRQLLTD